MGDSAELDDLPFPKGVFMMSPWTDLGGDGLRHTSADKGAQDYLPPDLVAWIAEVARGDLLEDDVLAAPVYVDGSLASLPPMFVVYGEEEVLCGQIEFFCNEWARKGANIERCVVKGGVHAPVLFCFCH